MSNIMKVLDGYDFSKADVISLGSLMKRIKERGKDDPSVEQVYVVSNTQGIVRAEDFRENTIHSEDTSNYTIIRKNMIAYNPSRLNIGSIAMLNSEMPGLVSPMYVVFRIDENKIQKEYFEYLIKSKHILSKIEAYKEEGARFRFDFNRWNWIKIPLPPLDVQKRIVEILNAFKKGIQGVEEELRLRNIQYDYYRNKVLREIGGESVKVIDICDDIFLGLTAKVDYVEEGGIPLVRANNMTSGVLTFDDVKCISEEQHEKLTKTHKAQKGDILISKSGTLGAVCVVDTDKEFSIYESLICLHPKKHVFNRYLLHLLRSQDVQEIMLEKKVGNAIKHLNIQTFRKLYISLPSYEEQIRISKMLDAFEELCNMPDRGLVAEIDMRESQFNYYQNLIMGLSDVKEV